MNKDIRIDFDNGVTMQMVLSQTVGEWTAAYLPLPLALSSSLKITVETVCGFAINRLAKVIVWTPEY